MARTWLQVMTGEIQAKREARERLEERRASNRDAVQACLTEVVQPGLQAAAEARGWYFEESGGGVGEATRCRIIADGTKPAYAEVSFDAMNPLAVLRKYPGGAGTRAESRVIRCDRLDRAELDAWLADE